MDRRNVDMRMKHEEENNMHNIQYLKKYVAYKNSDSGSHSNISERGNQNKKGSMVCVLCIWNTRVASTKINENYFWEKLKVEILGN